MADAPTDPGPGTKQQGDGSVIATGSGGDKADYGTRDWKWIMAVITGSAAMNAKDLEEFQTNQTTRSDPQSLWNGAATLRKTKEWLAAIGRNIDDQTKALVGEDGPWKGEAAESFAALARKLGNGFTAHAVQIDGGAERLQPAPENLWKAGSSLAWAIKQVYDIDNFYAGVAVDMANSMKPPDTDIIMKDPDGDRVHVGRYPAVADAMTTAMREVLVTLAKEYASQPYNIELVILPAPGPKPKPKPKGPGGGGDGDDKYEALARGMLIPKEQAAHGPDYQWKEPPEYKAPKYEPPPKFDPDAYNAPKFEAPKYDKANYDPNDFKAPPYEPPAYDPDKFKAPPYQPPAYDPDKFKAPPIQGPAFDPNQFKTPEYKAPKYQPPPKFDPKDYEPPKYNPPKYNQKAFDPPEYKPGQIPPFHPGQVPPYKPGQNGPGGGGSKFPGGVNNKGIDKPNPQDWKAGSGSNGSNGSGQNGSGQGGSGQGMGGMPMMPPMSPSNTKEGAERSDASGLLNGIDVPWKGVEPPGVGDPNPVNGTAGGSGQGQGQGLGGMPMMPPMSPANTKEGAERSDASGLLGDSEQWEGLDLEGVGDPIAEATAESTPEEWAAPAAEPVHEQAVLPVVPMLPAVPVREKKQPERSEASALLRQEPPEDRVAVVASADGEEDFSAWEVAGGGLSWLSSTPSTEEEPPPAWGHSAGRSTGVRPAETTGTPAVAIAGLIPPWIPPEKTLSSSGVEFDQEELEARRRAALKETEAEQEDEEQERTAADLLRQQTSAWAVEQPKAPGVIE
ncbi:hypothetical protein ACIA49_36440 [Kribbella sp. NPDC051587]|uniref:hypothetical protein n=1 Tax=Kribbella sp. NPDC051587 TaxID=3364119 RepID=UPI0037950BB7